MTHTHRIAALPSLFIIIAATLPALATPVARSQAAPPAQAQAAPARVETVSKTVCFQNDVDGYSGALETGIELGKGAQSKNAWNIWVDRAADHSGNLKSERQALVRFDGIFDGDPSQIPPGASITKAVLRLWVGANNDETSFHRIFLHRMLVPWDKKAAWQYPAWGDNGIRRDDRVAAAAPDAHFVPNLNNRAYDIDVTESLRAWARGEPNHGWALLDVRWNFKTAAFISSRAPNVSRRPSLSVSFDTAPANTAPKADGFASRFTDAATATLALNATDADNDPLTVTFHGRKRANAGPDFQVVLIPDTQYYTMERFGGAPEMFASQVVWITNNAKSRGIAFALHLGDITDTGDVHEKEWLIASRALSLLEDPSASGLPEGVPYCVAVGNHDQRHKDASGKVRGDGPALLYNKYFGAARFKGKSYYGGHFGDNNNNYYALFDAPGGEKFIVLSLEYAFPKRAPGVLKWADGLLEKHAARRAIIVTHATLFPGEPGGWDADGGAVYKALKKHKNLMLIMGGHTTGEGRRTDTHDGATVHSLVQDFQFDGNGGDGWLGILTFSPSANQIGVSTYSPWLDKWREDAAARYTLDYDFGAKIEPFVKIATVKPGPRGAAGCRWENLLPGADYECYAEITDGQKTIRTEIFVLKRE
jgi:hypothetical protein